MMLGHPLNMIALGPHRINKSPLTVVWASYRTRAAVLNWAAHPGGSKVQRGCKVNSSRAGCGLTLWAMYLYWADDISP
ncbi:hypothetical protein Hdeb2414_s0011g00367021 [Helianthus debilis subsp. tardiflorus]